MIHNGEPQGQIIMAATPPDVEESGSLVEVQAFIMREWAAFQGMTLKHGGLLTNIEEIRKIEVKGKKPPAVF